MRLDIPCCVAMKLRNRGTAAIENKNESAQFGGRGW